jgi:hypothetical protein
MPLNWWVRIAGRLFSTAGCCLPGILWFVSRLLFALRYEMRNKIRRMLVQHHCLIATHIRDQYIVLELWGPHRSNESGAMRIFVRLHSVSAVSGAYAVFLELSISGCGKIQLTPLSIVFMKPNFLHCGNAVWQKHRKPVGDSSGTTYTAIRQTCTKCHALSKGIR